MPTIVDMRRNLVDQGEIDPLLAQTLQNYANQGNSYGKSARMRARWTKGLEFTIPDARKEPVQYLWFVGDYASFDERAQEASRAVARILHGAGVSFGLLYEGERNAGNDVRRVGEEGMFEVLVEQNMAALAEAQFEAIFTTDPHSLNTLRNEYPPVRPRQAGLPLHRAARRPRRARGYLAADATDRHARHLPRPVLPGALQPRSPKRPRELIEATGAELVEMPRNGTNTFCCGAGGGRIWMEEVGRRGPAERAADPRGPDARGSRLLRRQLPQGPGHVLGRGRDGRRRVRGRRADGIDRARARRG